MIKKKEYLMLSMLAYLDFGSNDYNRTIYDLLTDSTKKRVSKTNAFLALSLSFLDQFLLFFEKELKKWSIFHVENRTFKESSSSRSGFYSIVYKNLEGKYIIGYRGSELSSIEDAYKDFVETDLLIGLGKIPLQLHEGVEVYDKLINELAIPEEDISITGHSLGGGIAEYVALIVNKKYGTIPSVCTWNAVGVSRDGIISLKDFVSLEKSLEKNQVLSETDKKYILEYNDLYSSFFIKELKRIGKVKKSNEINHKNKNKLIVDDKFRLRFLIQISPKILKNKIKSKKTRDYIFSKEFLEEMFDLDLIYEDLLEGEKFIKEFKRNVTYSEKVTNYGHSKDFTNSIFNHIGKHIVIDKNLVIIKRKKSFILDTMEIMSKFVYNCHLEDVFIPFLMIDGKEEGELSTYLNDEYISSIIRSMFEKKGVFSTDLLANYYNLIKINEENFENIKKDILKGIKNYSEKTLYKEKIYSEISESNLKRFSSIWNKAKKRLASPYVYKDIFDVIAYQI